MKVIERLGAGFANASFSGSMVEGDGFPAACSARRIGQVAGPAGESPDEILVFVGTNDYGWEGSRRRLRVAPQLLLPTWTIRRIPNAPRSRAGGRGGEVRCGVSHHAARCARGTSRCVHPVRDAASGTGAIWGVLRFATACAGSTSKSTTIGSREALRARRRAASQTSPRLGFDYDAVDGTT